MTRALAGALGAAAGVVAHRLVRSGLDEAVPGGTTTWLRTNHRGSRVSLMGGPALAVGLAPAALVAGALARRPRLGAAGAVAALGAGAAGLNDDLREDTEQRDKGLRGHLGALRDGRLTTGALKIAGIGACAGVAALIVGAERRRREPTGTVAAVLDLAVDGALVAGTANLVNLFDLRPGRALKVGALGALGVAATGAVPAAAAIAGPVVAALAGDLAARDMLGVSGANARGAVIGVGLTQAARPARLASVVAVVALTLASERVSFSQVIAKNRALAAVDAWGRQR